MEAAIKERTCASQPGVVVSVRGSVVDVRFDKCLPPIYSLLRAGTDGRIAIEVLSQLDAHRVRGIALTPTQGLSRGMAVEDTGGPLQAPVGREILSRMFDVFGKTIDRGEPVVGKISVNILEMARPGLKMDLTAAIRAVATNNNEVVRKSITVEQNGGHITIDLTVTPVLGHSALRGRMMVIFKEIEAAEKEKRAEKQTRSRAKNIDVSELEQELQRTRENLQTTIEELETANEELQSTNEELQSTNEELQSSNEELETSKEELQSLNEEASTVNAELQSRIDELSITNDDMKNLLDSTQIATIFLDRELGVRRFTPKAVEIIPLAAIDSGRPIKHFASALLDTDLAEYAHLVLEDLAMREKEVRSKDGACYRMRVRPYRTTNNVIEGVVITFEDITELKKIEASLNELNAELENRKVHPTAALDGDKGPSEG